MKHRFFKSFFFPSTIIKSNILDYHLRNGPSISVFKQNILKFIRLGPNKVCLDELCICGTNIESTNHFLLQYPLYLSERQTLTEKIRDVEISILDQNENCLCYTLLFGSDKLSDFKNVCTLSANIEYNLLTERFDVPL